jgi:hypothetical protein
LTHRTYGGGNNSELNAINPSAVEASLRNGNLSSVVKSKVIGQLMNDSEVSAMIIEGVNSDLGTTTVSTLNSSSIAKIVRNGFLPQEVADNVISRLMNESSRISEIVVNETRATLVSELKIKILLDFQIGLNNFYYFYPAIATANENLLLYFGFSSKDTYPSLGLLILNTSSIARNGSSVNDRLDYEPILIKNGTTYAEEETINNTSYCTPSAPCTRYGDYFSITNDPFNDWVFWAAGEYYDGKRFSTVISTIKMK